MLISTIIPIPKNRRTSLNDSDNYSGTDLNNKSINHLSSNKSIKHLSVYLSSILGKVLDWVILFLCGGALQSSDAQLGFKPKHSTSQCTF